MRTVKNLLLHSTRFGDMEVAEEQILDFPHGVPGFPAEKQFVFLDYQPDSPFYFLQSVLDADLTFLLIDPFAFFNDYEFAMDDALAEEIGVTRDNPPTIFNIATVKGKLENMTVNLVAPVIVNTRDRKAVQIVLEKTDYATRYPLFPEGLPDQPAHTGGK